ncbi:radial spoke head protein 9 homolog [Microplitis mediator]|uniref:radial spoke head protein 9 homolog n=1 Tax=Microplitis mediator TaxID=375433 RepID=UPI002555615E|nr:radial spoke head protein 9 homolog [Microplitis mediator]
MEFNKLSESIDTVGYAGVCVGTERSELLKNSLLLLGKENNFDKIYYWGRINGILKDYHVAYGHGKDYLRNNVYYYSFDCFDWLLLPQPTKNQKVISTFMRNYFQGEPSVKKLTEVPEFLLYNDEEMPKSIEGDIIPCEIKEEDRLSAAVDLITNDSIIIPRGSWIKLPSGDVAKNLTFTGLNFTECTKLESYLHKRIPQEKSNVSLTKRQDYNFALDFLDPIDMDLPKECWSLQPYFKDNLIIIRNLYWPGMTFYHKLNSSEYGSIYIDDGIKNKNLSFMI